MLAAARRASSSAAPLPPGRDPRMQPPTTCWSSCCTRATISRPSRRSGAHRARASSTSAWGLPVAAVVPVRQFPKTTSGKVQRFALARDYEDGRFARRARASSPGTTPDPAAPEVAAATALEQTLLTICQAALPDRKLVARRQSLRDRHGLAHAGADLREGREHVSRIPGGHRLLRVSDGAHDGGLPARRRKSGQALESARWARD